jgi:uncharacterized FlaG/YvyC family protein
MNRSAMSLEIGRFTHFMPPATLHRDPTAARAAKPERPADIPAEPPAEVRAQVDAAAKRAADLAASNRELHFAKDEQSGRIVIQVRELDGRVIRTIPPSHALAFMTGGL